MRGAVARFRPTAPVAALLLALALLAPASSADPAPAYYLALGDSLARGVQPDASGRGRETDEGYVDDVAAALRSRHPRLRVIKLGCSGETTASMLRGGRCRYAAGSQLAEAEEFLRAHHRDVVAVTVNVGDNDVEGCLGGGTLDSDCVQRTMAGMSGRLPQIARRLRTAAGRDVPMAGLGDYDQFLAYWLNGPSGRRFARRSVAVLEQLNSTFARIYADAGIRSADAAHAFATAEVTPRRRGALPTGVRRVCAWTWACSRPPIGFNDHANARGYKVLARVLLAALGA